MNAGPRSTPLDEGDSSGGIRSLQNTIYNGNPYSGSSGEDWGPGTNWACLSWKISMVTSQAIQQHQQTTNGIQTLPRLFYGF